MRFKYLFVYLIVVLLPLACTFANKCYVGSKYFIWDWACPRNLIYPLTIIPFTGALWIVVSNYRTKTHSVAWYVIAGLSTLIIGLHLLVVLMLFANPNKLIFL
jgi:hypothetical protein